MSALTQRVIAAMVLIPAVVAAVLWLPSSGFALMLGVFAQLGAWEWCRVGQLPRSAHPVSRAPPSAGVSSLPSRRSLRDDGR